MPVDDRLLVVESRDIDLAGQLAVFIGRRCAREVDMRDLEVGGRDKLYAGDLGNDGQYLGVLPGLIDEGGLLLSVATQLSSCKIRRILVVVHDLGLEDLLAHVLDRFGTKELKRFGDGDARNGGVLELNVRHRSGLRHLREGEMLLGVEDRVVGSLGCLQGKLQFVG